MRASQTKTLVMMPSTQRRSQAPRNAPQPTPMIAPAERMVRRAGVEDVLGLRSALASAFFEDPVFSWLLPGDASRHRRLRTFFGLELTHLALVKGTVWSTPALEGAALCMPPRTWRLPPRLLFEQRRRLLGAFGLRLPRATGLLNTVERHHPKGAHYYILAIGVEPNAQGKGVGSALMAPTLERCDLEGLPAYLEASSERSASLYRRLGFETIEEVRFLGSPPLWLMLRPPSQTAGNRASATGRPASEAATRATR